MRLSGERRMQMKVYSWKNLLVTVLAGGVIVYFLWRLIAQGRWSSLVWIAWFVYLFVQGLWASLTEEGYEKDQENARRGEVLCRKLFGRRARFMRYLHLYAMVLGIALCCIPGFPWFGVAVICAALIYIIVLGTVLRRAIKKGLDREAPEEAASGDQAE